MLKEALVKFVTDHGKHWSLTQADSVYTELVRAHMFGGVWEMRRTLKELTNKETSILLEEKIGSKFTHTKRYRDLWRAVMETICSDLSVREVAFRHKVSIKDIYFEYDRLTGEQCKKLYIQARKGDWCLDPIDNQLYSQLALKLQTFAKNTASQRLWFIAKYDRGLCLDDLASELWLEGCRVLQWNWHLSSNTSRLNSARRAIVNEALDLLNYHTNEARSRLASVEIDTHSPHRNFERFATTLSFEKVPSVRSLSSSSQDMCLHNLYMDQNSYNNDIRHTLDVIKILGEGLSDKYIQFLNIISLEALPRDFEKYVQDTYNKTLEEVTLDQKRPAYWNNGRKPKHEDFAKVVNYRKLSKLACRWLNIKQEDLKRHLGPRLRQFVQEEGGSDTGRLPPTSLRGLMPFQKMSSYI